MKRQIISIVKRTMGFLLCICIAGLFVLLMTWLILELRGESSDAQAVVFGSALSTATSLPADGQYDSWETRVRVDKAWRDEYLQNEMSLEAEFDSYGDEQDQQSMRVADTQGYAAEK